MTAPRYSDLISEVAGTGVEYTGDFLTNSTIHSRIRQIGVELGEIGGRLGVHEDMQGATAEAAREALGKSRAGLQGVEDALGAISGAATGASAVIDSGKSSDAAVKAAQRASEAEYAKHSQGAGEDPDEKVADDETTTGGDKGDGGGSNRDKPGQDQKGGGTPKPGSPSTHVSSDSDGSQRGGSGSGSGPSSPTAPAASTVQPAAAQQPMQMPMATGQPMGQAGGGMQQPGGMPMSVSPQTSTGSPVSKSDYSRMIADAVREATAKGSPLGDQRIPRGISPKADPSGSDGPAVVTTPVPTGNPTVQGSAVDPAQTSGRTTSTTTSGAPGAGVPAKPTGPMPMGGGMMGGMGPMGNMGGGQPPAGPSSPPRIRRDRETEKVLDGSAAWDKALVSSVLRDDDLITGGADDEGTDALLDDLRNSPRDRPTAAPELPPTPPAMVLRDDEPSAPPQRPGEPAEHEKW